MAEMRWRWRVDEALRTAATTESQADFVDRFSDFVITALAERWTAWVVEDHGSLLANIWIFRVPKVPSPDDAGIGTQLLASVTDWAAAEALELIAVWPSERSVPWYARAGFTPPADMLTCEIAGYEG
jgi:GNAT superfamily N-acetyltransferase